MDYPGKSGRVGRSAWPVVHAGLITPKCHHARVTHDYARVRPHYARAVLVSSQTADYAQTGQIIKTISHLWIGLGLTRGS